MDEVWAKLQEATGNDHALITFLQQLLTVDPAPRANFGELVRNSSYLQGSVPVSPAASLPVSLTPPLAEPKTALPLQMVPGPYLEKHVLRDLEQVPGLPSVFWDPTAAAICQLSSGAVYSYITACPLSPCTTELCCASRTTCCSEELVCSDSRTAPDHDSKRPCNALTQ